MKKIKENEGNKGNMKEIWREYEGITKEKGSKYEGNMKEICRHYERNMK